MINTDNLSSITATLGGGLFVGILVGWAIKKVIKIAAVVVGLFLAGIAYLQYQQIVIINWDKVQAISKAAAKTITNITMQLPGISNDYHNVVAAQVMTNFGIPLTGSMAAGFAIGFMRS